MSPRRVRLEDLVRALQPWPELLPAPPTALEARLVLGRGSLPGVPAPPATSTREGAVLVLLHPGVDGEAHVLLTERPRGELRHPGEVSFPGGAVEPNDVSVEAAALREAAEEVGLDPVTAGVRILGRLEIVEVRVSGFRLTPVVAVAAKRPEVVPDPREVAAIVEPPLGRFLSGAPIETVEEERAGRLLRYGYFPVEGYRVWGATGRILGQLGALVDERLP